MSLINLTPHTEDGFEKDINTALHAMGNSAPPDGMQSRVLRHARLAAIATSDRARTSIRLPLLVGAAFVVACTAVFVAARHEQSTKLRTIDSRVALIAPHSPLAETKSELAFSDKTPHAPPQEHIRWVGSGNRADVRVMPVPSLPVENRPGDASNAPSMPAPALPLTNQERLLLVAVDAQTPKIQLAQLRRPVWPLRDPADDEDFSKFFDAPTPTATNGETE